MEVKLATKIRREKNENCVEFSFHSISGSKRRGESIGSQCAKKKSFPHGKNEEREETIRSKEV